MVLSRFLEILKQDRVALICFVIFCIFILIGFLSLLLSSPYTSYEDLLMVPPFSQNDLSFIFGTDDLGRNFFVRIMNGARYSIFIGISVVLLSVLVGTTLGLLSGYMGGRVDQWIMRFVDLLMSFPSILIAIIIVTILGPGLVNAIVAVNVIAWPGVIRVVRSVVLKEKQKDYVQAAKSFGASRFRILFINILPNCVAPLSVQAILNFSEGILNVAALGFLGLGAEPPTPEWGVMIGDGRAYMQSAWWLITLPGLFLFILVLSVNVIGESLRDAFDPKIKTYRKQKK